MINDFKISDFVIGQIILEGLFEMLPDVLSELFQIYCLR